MLVNMISQMRAISLRNKAFSGLMKSAESVHFNTFLAPVQNDTFDSLARLDAQNSLNRALLETQAKVAQAELDSLEKQKS